MARRFIISDHHLKHARLYQWRNPDGSSTRPWAQGMEDADAQMITAHNETVKAGDTCYFLGDVAINAKGLKLLEQMNGRKILVRGNHDIFRLKQYLEHFADIRGSHKLGRMILTHYPIHPGSVPPWCVANVHGHTHANRVMRRTWYGRRVQDLRYFNACVETLGIHPVEVESLEAQLLARRGWSEKAS